MKYVYYLETNALYHLSKVRREILDNSFTSALAILELIAGINAEEFQKRKYLLANINQKRLNVVWELPQKIIFDSFDITEPHLLVDKRIDLIQEINQLILESETFDQFMLLDQKKDENENFAYVKSIEENWALPFVSSIILGQMVMRWSALKNPNQTYEIENRSYDISTVSQFITFSKNEPLLFKKLFIDAYANSLITDETQKLGFTEETVAMSYNGLLDHHIDAKIKHTNHLLVEGNSFKMNDFVDLLHLMYLRNYSDCRIVSDDRIFDRLQPDMRIKLADVQ